MFLVLHLNSVSQLCSWIFNLEVKHVVYLFLLLLLMLSIAARRMAAIPGPGPGPGRRRHFNYTLRYNAVTMKEVQFKKSPGDAGAYFKSATHCIYIHQTKNINKKKASAAKNESISELVSIDTIFPQLSRDITEYENKVFNKATLQMVLTF